MNHEQVPEEIELPEPNPFSPATWKWKAENLIRWIESGVLLKDHDSRVTFLSQEYARIFDSGFYRGLQARGRRQQAEESACSGNNGE